MIRLQLGGVLLIFLFLPFTAFSQSETEYEEILVSLNVQGIGTIETSALIKDEEIWLPVTEVFDFLKIKNTLSSRMDSVTGFFLNESAVYVLDKANNRIIYGKKEINLKPDDLVKTETNLYLKLSYFHEIFELDGVFNFRSLLVNITTKLELPVIRELRLDMIRRNISRLKGEIIADTNVRKSNPFFHFGMADWSIISNQVNNGTGDNRYSLGLGALVAGGELKAFLNISDNVPIEEKNQFYNWRYVNNSNKVVRQLSLGRVITPTVASIFAPVSGIQLTNAPTTLRRSFGSYTISNKTEPGWAVELYINNVLVDFQTADASGFYSFEIPLVYGNSVIKLRFYGPFGEERFKEENVNIPFNFLPVKEFEYNVSGGIVRDDSSSRFSKGTITYGLSNRITVSAGMEYLTSIRTGHFIPLGSASFRLSRNLLISGEYAHNVRSKGVLTYRTKQNWQLALNYTRYTEGQQAINITALEERRAVLSMPLRGKKLSLFSLLTVNQTILASTRYTTAEWMLTGLIFKRTFNINTYSIFTREADPYFYSNVSSSFNIRRKYTFNPEIQYEYNTNRIIAVKGMLERRFGQRFLASVSYEENFKSHLRTLGLQLRYDLPFAQMGVTARKLNDNISLLEIARGSIMLDAKTKYVAVNNSTSVGKSGIAILPYLDINCNEKRDPGEPKVTGLKFRISSGRVQPESKDTITRIPDLEPFVPYFVELNRFSFDNIAWQIDKKILRITTEPNYFKLIEVPISVYAEASGNVYIIKNGVQKGQGQIKIGFYKNDSLVAKTVSEPDGYFSYLGLKPGEYIARIDPEQLKKINMNAEVAEYPFTVANTSDGDVIDGLDFTLKPIMIDPPPQQKPVEEPVKEKEKKKLPVKTKKK